MLSFQSQTAKSTSQKHCGHSSPGASPSRFSMPGTWERPGGKCFGNNRPFHQVCPGICYKDPKWLKQWQRPCGTSSLSTMVFPKKILTDQGHNFEMQLVADLCELMGVQKIWTSPYHLQTNGQCERFNSTLINMLGTLPMFGRQPHLPVDVALGLAPCTITEPNTTKFVQKLRERNKWAHEKVEAFQAKEAKRHKRNYNKKGRAAALEVRDMVLVHVTSFKGQHKMQDRWENREYVVEKQPYPDLPVYVVCPRDGEGHSQTLHRNYLLPISSNMGQDETDRSEDRVENNTSLTPVPSVSGSTQSSPDQPAPVRCGIWTTRGQLPWRYRNFGWLTDTRPTSIWDARVDLQVCLHILIWLYKTFKWGAV